MKANSVSNAMKLLFISSFLGVASMAQAASAPGANVSRANCWAPFFMLDSGTGWYNESFTYSKIGRKHTAYVTSTQALSGSNRVDTLKSGRGYKTSWRIYAGRTEPTNSKNFWNVTGTHKEILDNGQTVKSTTRATGCNYTSW